MKKKVRRSGDVSPGQQATDYTVGQVSGSLFQNVAASGSLSALFSSTTPTAAVVFEPAARPVVQKSIEPKETAKVKVQTSKAPKKKSAADQKLENWESSLQNADEAERAKEESVKKKKRKAEPHEEKEAEHWVKKRQKLRAMKQEEAVKCRRTVFVGNLPVSCTKKTLRSLFSEAGAIESIRFRSVVREDPSMSRKVATITRKAHPKKQTMNAYVVFKDEGGVTAALQRNGNEIETDFHIRVDRVSSNSAHDHKRSVFVGNLSFEIKELMVRRHFEECGSVAAVRLVRDKNSGLGKGFGYVLFESADSVQLALKLDGSKLEGRALRVHRSMTKEKQKAATKNPGKAGGGVARGRFKSTNKLSGNKRTAPVSFKGEMADPKKRKLKKKVVKKKMKPKKNVHM